MEHIDKKEALAFAKSQETGVLATIHADGRPAARLVYYTCDEDLNLYFITLSNTRKVSDMEKDPRAAFVISTLETPLTLQIEGEVEDVTETATNDSMLEEFVHKLTSHTTYNIPLTHMDTGELRFFRLKSSWIRFGNFTSGERSADVFSTVEGDN